MKDVCGQTLEQGDIVVVTPKNYRGLVPAKIKNFTAMKVRVIYMNTWNYGRPGRPEEYLINPNDCVKHPDQSVDLRLPE